ncbi:MAG: hypothetical protein R2695_14180 [Acidimicrobiales bacterium]
MAVIEATGLRKEYRGGIVAVDGLDLVVEGPGVHGFLGPNGSGRPPPSAACSGSSGPPPAPHGCSVPTSATSTP